MSDEEVRLHLEKAGQKIEVARRLLAEGFYDDAVSRGYYAMFHPAHALLRSKGLTARSHRGVAILLQDHFVPDPIPNELLDDFRREQSARESGDYDVLSGIEPDAAADLVERAARFVTHIEEVLL